MTYECPQCGSDNCMVIHNDVDAGVDVVLCEDCEHEFTVDRDPKQGKSWLIEKHEVWIQPVVIPVSAAPTLEDALKIAQGDDGENVNESGCAYFGYALGVETWSAHGPDGKFYNKLSASEGL